MPRQKGDRQMGPSLKVNQKRCVGCRICEQICSWTHVGKVQPSKSRIRVKRNHPAYQNIPRVCRQCKRAPCINVCPVQTLHRGSITNAVVVDEAKCTGCGECQDACPFDAIFMDPGTEVVLICDLCGTDPQCVRYCPTGAIEVRKKEAVLEPGKGKDDE